MKGLASMPQSTTLSPRQTAHYMTRDTINPPGRNRLRSRISSLAPLAPHRFDHRNAPDVGTPRERPF